VRTSTSPDEHPSGPAWPPAGRRPRRRFGYDHRFWGEAQPISGERFASYWVVTRRPLPCLAFVAPLLLVYELGVLWQGGARAEAWRTGADAWMRHGLATLGLTDRWFPPLCLALALLVWHVLAAREWRFSPFVPLAMALESVVLAVALVGLSKLVDLGFENLERSPSWLLTTSASPWAAASADRDRPAALLIGFLGAGVYEEALFRLLLIPVAFRALRLLQTPVVLASTLAVTASALLFSLAHHAGTPGEPFTWFAFIFRWAAGVYFAWVFVLRGFGVAVGTHTAYDILVGTFGWHL
jgi:hypothetical protein